MQLSSASRSEVVEQSKTTMVLSSDVQFYPKGRLRLDVAGAQAQIITHVLEQILINSVQIKEIVG